MRKQSLPIDSILFAHSHIVVFADTVIIELNCDCELPQTQNQVQNAKNAMNETKIMKTWVIQSRTRARTANSSSLASSTDGKTKQKKNY